jgi:predicted methyltransferase
MTPQPHRSRRSFVSNLALLGASGAVLATLPGCAAFAPAPDYDAVVASPLRPDADRKADARRLPADLLRLAMVRPGMSVLDISAGGGYTTQVMSTAVGERGRVWAQAPKPGPALLARAKAAPANIEVLARAFDDPFPADAPRVDLVTLILSYHDIVNTPTDRMKMNRAMFNALKPGGRLVMMDHSGRPGTGIAETNTLHRIEEPVLRREIEAAGFVFEADSAAWRNAADPRDTHWNQAKPSSDKFALRFVRPR